MRRTIIAVVLPFVFLSSSCVTFVDHCEHVICPEKQICLDLEKGPTCVCDGYHEDKGGECVDPPPEPAEDIDAGPADAASP